MKPEVSNKSDSNNISSLQAINFVKDALKDVLIKIVLLNYIENSKN
jgi:hypothetical protein